MQKGSLEEKNNVDISLENLEITKSQNNQKELSNDFKSSENIDELNNSKNTRKKG